VQILAGMNTTDDLAKKSFYLNDFLVEPQKGFIEVAGERNQIEPKVMDVLLHLACNLGDVVEQEVLFTQVWPKSIYSPGSIRRCITVLRKIFQDDNKSLIVTHPKRGYSLQGKVHFPKVKDNNMTENTKSTVSIIVFFIAVLIISISALFFFLEPEDVDINVSFISPLTASELQEDNAQFSPNGQYIAFIRTSKNNESLSHIWLKNINTEQEHQLTEQAADSKSLVWMQQGKALLYVSIKKQTISINRITLDEQAQAISEIEVLNLPNLTWISPIAWAESNDLYYVLKRAGKYQLVKSNLTNGEQNILFKEDDSFHPYSIALSKNSKQLAIFGFNQQYNSTVKIIAINKLSTKTLTKTKEIVLGKNKYYGSWHPNHKSLVIHDGRDLLSLNIGGAMKKIAFENYQYIKHPRFSPDGKQILLTRQVLDEDIWLTPSDSQAQAIKVIDSNTSDYLASLSPNGKKIAFVSIKRGFPQLFAYDIKSGKQTLLFANPKQLLFISYPIWNQASNKIASALNQRPFIIELTNHDHQTTQLTYAKGVPEQWFFNEESLLLVNYAQEGRAYVKLSLASKSTTTLRNSVAEHAHLNDNNKLLLITDTAIINTSSHDQQQVTLASIDGRIIDHYPTSSGIYLKVKEHENFSLWLYSFAKNDLKKLNKLNEKIKIWDVETHNNFMLTSSQRSGKDLLLLTLEYSD
jgi:DNA-binding winged helix-turn-helix (wHTH) protein